VERPWFARVAAPVCVALLLLAVWQNLCTVYEVPKYLFPKPTDVLESLIENHVTLLWALLSTLKVTAYAFGLSVLLGTTVAFLFVQSKLLELSLFPYAVLFQVTPVAAIAPLIVILVKDTTTALTLCATVIALFPIISNTTIGLRSVDPGLAAYFEMNKAGRWQMLWRLRIPSALPFFMAGLRISSGLALVGAVVAEFIAGTGGNSAGLAYQIMQASFQLDIPQMFAALLLIALTGVALFGAMIQLQQFLLGHWHESALKAER